MSRSFSVAVVGATGAVGAEMLRTLAERRFPIRELVAIASPRSEGRSLPFAGTTVPVRPIEERLFEGIDLALFSAGATTSREWAPRAAARGAIVVDNSSAWRMDPEVPLVVPEVNGDAALDAPSRRRIVGNPNCSTIQLVVALAPLHAVARLRRVVVTTLQSVSGAGARAMAELERQVRAHAAGEPYAAEVFPHPIAFNALPHIDAFLPDGYTKEEMKLVHETRKILGEPTLRVTATCVRVPVLVGHSEAVNIETERRLGAAEARELLRRAPGVEVIDEPEARRYPLAREAAGRDATFVGRIREDDSCPHGLNLWIVSDNLRKGAALNAVQIAEHLAARGALGR